LELYKQTVEKRALERCLQIVENQGFEAYTKGTPKAHQNSKALKIKHLLKFFGVLGVISGKGSFLTPTDPLTDPARLPKLSTLLGQP
jgi:hypothetical protein